MNLRDAFQVTLYNQVPALAYGLMLSSAVALGLVFWTESLHSSAADQGAVDSSAADQSAISLDQDPNVEDTNEQSQGILASVSNAAASLEDSAQNFMSAAIGDSGDSH